MIGFPANRNLHTTASPRGKAPSLIEWEACAGYQMLKFEADRQTLRAETYFLCSTCVKNSDGVFVCVFTILRPFKGSLCNQTQEGWKTKGRFKGRPTKGKGAKRKGEGKANSRGTEKRRAEARNTRRRFKLRD